MRCCYSIPVNPNKIPELDLEELSHLPVGYRYLGYCQEKTMGIVVIKSLPGHRREIGTVNREKHDMLYRQIKAWMDGENIDV